MDIGSASTAKAATASSEAQVSVLNNQRKQQEAVVGTLLESAEAPRVEGQSGQIVNVKA
jgi:hypothetical protein